ncbi:MAG: response regulator [Anaerolineae bacterium]
MTSDRPRILIVDDDESIRAALAALLGRAGFQPLLATDVASALAMATAELPDLVLLDVVLNESEPTAATGIDVLRQIRALERFIPVIMLTSYGEWQLESLGQGAIAFMTKPFDTNALIGQIRATLNAVAHIRREAQHNVEEAVKLLRVRDLVIDTYRLRVTRAGRDIDLTPLEIALLIFLARNPNREWTREALLDKVWGYEWVGYPRTVDRHVAALRRKLQLERDELIETVHGSGYRLVP